MQAQNDSSAPTRLSVNVNKVATLRNARGENLPDLLAVSLDCEDFGAQGITVHPRPDERHVRYADVRALRQHLRTELNVEGYPSRSFVELVLETRPEQVTLVPDAPDALTSNAGWDAVVHGQRLAELVRQFHQGGIRVSLFVETGLENIRAAAATGADRVELFTGPYAKAFAQDKEQAVAPYREAARLAHELGLRVNAGHDLNLANLAFFRQQVPHLAEVSIGHALICDALYFGLENTIQMYRRELGH